MAIICSKKHLHSRILTNNEVTDNNPLPHMSQYQMQRYLKKLMFHSARDVLEKFRKGNKVYVIDADTEVEGLLLNDVQRQKFQSEAHDLCNRIKDLQ